MSEPWDHLNYEQALEKLNQVDAELRAVNAQLAGKLDWMRRQKLTETRQKLVGQVHALQRRVKRLRPVTDETRMAREFMRAAALLLTEEVYTNIKQQAEEVLRHDDH